MKAPVWHCYRNGVHHYWGLLFSRWGILHLKRYREGRYAATKVRGIVWHGFSIQLLNHYVRKHHESTSRTTLSYFIRRPIFKFSMATRLFWRYLWNGDMKMCEMCGESFAVTEMRNPNWDYDHVLEPSRLKVCRACPEWVKETQQRHAEDYFDRKLKEVSACPTGKPLSC